MADLVVEIRVQTEPKEPGYGSVNYTWSALHAAPGDNVTWISKQGPFALVFRERSPFVGNKHRISSQGKGNGRPFTTETLAVAKGAEVHGTYYYGVAVAVRNEIFTDSGCPSVIID